MVTFLDLMVMVFMVLAAGGALALCMMFLARRPRIKQVCLYVAAALGVYVCTVSVRIAGSMFPEQMIAGLVLGLGSVAAVVLERMSKGDEKKQKIARILAAASLVLGLANAFLW